MANELACYERETPTAQFNFTDEDGNVLLLADIDMLIVTIHYTDAADVRQYVRSSDDVLSDAGFSVDGAGLWTWNLQSFETRFDGETPLDALGDALEKTVTFELVYFSTSSGTLASPFATTAGSRDVTVTHSAHGFAVNDDISFLAPVTVGGLDLSGRYIVEEVVDTDTYKIKALSTATDTATGGGSVDWFHGGKYRPDTVALDIERIDPVG